MMEVAGTSETQKTDIFTVKGFRRGDDCRPATSQIAHPLAVSCGVGHWRGP